MSKNVPKIRFKREDGREYPEWEEKRVDEVFDITRGIVIAKTSIEGDRHDEFIYPVYSSQTTRNGILGYTNVYRFNGNFLTWTTDGANAGRVFTRKGKFNCTNVCGVLVERKNMKGFANQYVSEALNKVTPRHVSYVGNPKLMNNVMAEVKINYPCIEEQQKIATFLSTIDSRIEVQSDKVGNLEEMKKGLMQKLFSQEIRFKKEDGSEYQEWVEMTIGDALKIKHGRNQKEIEVPNGKYPILGTGGQMGSTNTPIWSKPSVLIGRKGTINKPQYMETPFWTVDTLFYSDVFEDNSAKFMFYLFQQINWLLYNEASGVPSLSSHTVESIDIVMPLIEEQQKIATFFTTIDEKIELEKDILGVLTELKKGLLQQMFV